jgi:hypothetical protein
MLVPTVMNWFDEPASSVRPVGVDDLRDGDRFRYTMCFDVGEGAQTLFPLGRGADAVTGPDRQGARLLGPAFLAFVLSPFRLRQIFLEFPGNAGTGDSFC